MRRKMKKMDPVMMKGFQRLFARKLPPTKDAMIDFEQRSSKLFWDALLKGGVTSSGARPSGLCLERSTEFENEFWLYITRKDGSKLSQVAHFTIDPGQSVTFADVHRIFEIRLVPS